MRDSGDSRESVRFSADRVVLEGDLVVPGGARGVVLFAHGSGSSRHSPRNRFVAQVLNEAGMATFLFDLLTEQEEAEDMTTGHLRFNIPFLAERVLAATDWVEQQPVVAGLRVGYFGASTGAAAALLAGAEREDIDAIVSRGGRPDLAGPVLPRVKAPTLLIVGSRDTEVIQLNRLAQAALNCINELRIIPGATHLFEEPGTLEQVAEAAADWFQRYLGAEVRAEEAA